MSTSVQIKDKYFQLAKQFHPDVSKDPEHTKKFTLINEAYDTLKDQTKRRNYDQTLDFENYNVHQNKSAFTQQNYKSYDGTQRVYRPRYEDYDQNYQKTYQRARQQFRNRLIVNFAFGFLATIAAFLFLSKRDIPDENQIRRKNLILANQNINSSPQAISRRQIQYAQQMKDKKFSIVVVQKQLNRYGNAFLNRQQMKDKNKIGKSLSTIQRTHKKPQILRIPGIKKISENQNTQNIQIHAQQYI